MSPSQVMMVAKMVPFSIMSTSFGKILIISQLLRIINRNAEMLPIGF